MRKIGWIVAIAAAPAVAFAQGTMQGRSAEEQRGQQRAEQRLPKDTRAVKQFRAEDGFFTSNNFDVEGRISKVSKDKITITREDNLPAAELAIASNTRLEVDGETASAAQLREGQEVKASFNLRGETPVAISIEAEKLDERQGSERRAPGSTGADTDRPGRPGDTSGSGASERRRY
jgi:hypothetical protein